MSSHDDTQLQFQFALPRGERHGGFYRNKGRCMVSIRAPARGATLYRRLVERELRLFQFALPRGERHTRAQPSPRRRRRFNSRSREGSDTHQLTEMPSISRFQFALPRGERHAGDEAAHGIGGVSIRAPASGWQVLSGISQRRALACQQGTGG